MAITEEVRHKVYEAIRASHGDEVANGLMEMLPPVGWADVATKHDLDVLRVMLEERMNLRFERLEESIDLRFQIVDERFERADQRFDLMEARIGERLERAMRLQSARFMTAMAAMFTAFGLIDRLVLS